MKYTRYQDVPQFTRDSSYQVNVHWESIEWTLEGFQRDYGLDLDPDFQRAHVWTETQQVRFVEFVLRGGHSSRAIQFNAKNWNGGGAAGQVILVDGKQRLEAVRKFMRGELKVFDSVYSEFTDRLRMCKADFVFHINDLSTRAEVLQWYLDLNNGGVIHTSDEIEKVRKLLLLEKAETDGIQKTNNETPKEAVQQRVFPSRRQKVRDVRPK